MTSSTDPGQKSTTEIERELDDERAGLRRTSQELQERFTVGAVVDEFLNRSRGHGGEYASNLGRIIRDNPLPVTIIGVCLAWMAAGGQRQREHRHYLGSDRDGGAGRQIGSDEEGGRGLRADERSALSPGAAPRAAPPGDSVREHTPAGGIPPREPGPGAAGPGTSGRGEDPLSLSERTRTPEGPSGKSPGGSGPIDIGHGTPPPPSRPAEAPGSEPEGSDRSSEQGESEKKR